MKDEIYSVANGIAWTLVMAVGATTCYCNQAGWTVFPKWGFIVLTGLAILLTLWRVVLLGMAGLTHGLLAIPKAIWFIGVWTCRGLGVIGHRGSPIFRYYIFRRSFASMLGFAIASIGGGGMMAFSHSTGSGGGLFTVPVLIGIIFPLIPDLCERIKASRIVERLWLVGGKPNEEWRSNYSLRKDCAKLKKGERETDGYLSSQRYLGQTPAEYTGRPLHVWTGDPGCEVNIAMVGGTKFVTDIAIQLALYLGSLVAISTKPELIDTCCGRRCDPAWHEGLANRTGLHPGVDARGITKVKYYIPNSRAFVLDSGKQSAYPDSRYQFLHEINLSNVVEAVALIGLLAMALLPDNLKASDPYWRNMARRLIKFVIGVVVTTYPREKRNLVSVVELLKGIDPITRRADPTKLQELIIRGLRNSELNGTIQSDASDLAKASDKQMGSIVAEAGNALAWVLTMREHLSGEPQFSYRELGDDLYPTTVLIVPDTMDKSASTPYMRCHAAFASNLIVRREKRPKTPTWIGCDEAPQYLAGSGIPDIALIARAANLKIALYGQSYPAFEKAIGEMEFEMFCSSSTERYYAINDVKTAERIVRLLGEQTDRHGDVNKVVTVQDIMNRELSLTSPLQYVKPYSGSVMKLMRRSFVDINTPQGLKIKGLKELQGHFDTDLSRFS